MPSLHRRGWGGTRANLLSKLTLARDYDPDLGYTPCKWCGKPADTADHYPVSRMNGGSNELSNLVSACMHCNASKGATQGNRARKTQPSRQW